MARFGSDRQYLSNNLSSNTDAGGNAIISPDNGFGGSPLGPAAIAQSLYAVANPLFNLTPPDVLSVIAPDNQIPYWQFSNYSNSMSGSMFFDSTAQTWAVRLNPGTAAAGEYITLKTRSYLINDSNLNLRQKALATITKVGTYSSTNQWNLVMTATYYDVTGASLHSYAIGTAADNGTWTSITGNTTSGGTAVNAAAAYVDLDFTLTAAATVSGTAKVDIESLLLATSTTATGAFLVTQTFNASGTWTRPTGVNYVSVVGQGAGGGGASGKISVYRTLSENAPEGGGGGGSGQWAFLRDIYVGDVATVSVGIGAGGTAGAGSSYTKVAGGNTAYITSTGNAGGAGAATTFGSYLSIPAGAGGSSISRDGGTVGGTPTALVYGIASLAGTSGASGANNATISSGPAAAISAFTYGAPFTVLVAGGGTGTVGTASGGTSGSAGAAGTPSATTGLGGGGGGGAFATIQAGGVFSLSAGGVGGAGGGGGGGGGITRMGSAATLTTYTIVATAGNGGAGLANSGGGGGGGGAVATFVTGGGAGTPNNYSTSTITVTSGAGGAGATGFVTVVWTA